MRRLSVLLLIVGGCGPLTGPMVERLPAEAQEQVDGIWQNIFSPPGRLDRTLLLDVLISIQAHQRGVDRLDMVSEKRVGEGRVIMIIRFDREHPEFDEYTITYTDERGREVRRERYTPQEIQQRFEFLYGRPSVTDGTREISKEDRERCRAVEARMKEIEAATQPAR